MSSTSALERELEDKRRLRDEKKTALRALEQHLAQVNARRVALEDLWGASAAGIPLPVRPLVLAIVAVIAGNAAAFSGYVVALTKWREPFWAGLYATLLAITVACLVFSGGFGAGGRARSVLRATTVAFLGFALIEGVVAAGLIFR
jgi:hypothetical protein